MLRPCHPNGFLNVFSSLIITLFQTIPHILSFVLPISSLHQHGSTFSYHHPRSIPICPSMRNIQSKSANVRDALHSHSKWRAVPMKWMEPMLSPSKSLEFRNFGSSKPLRKGKRHWRKYTKSVAAAHCLNSVLLSTIAGCYSIAIPKTLCPLNTMPLRWSRCTIKPLPLRAGSVSAALNQHQGSSPSTSRRSNLNSIRSKPKFWWISLFLKWQFLRYFITGKVSGNFPESNSNDNFWW